MKARGAVRLKIRSRPGIDGEVLAVYPIECRKRSEQNVNGQTGVVSGKSVAERNPKSPTLLSAIPDKMLSASSGLGERDTGRQLYDLIDQEADDPPHIEVERRIGINDCQYPIAHRYLKTCQPLVMSMSLICYSCCLALLSVRKPLR